jgi:hypothetical protein
MLASQDFAALEESFPLLFEEGGPRGGPSGASVPEALLPWIGHLVELDKMAELLPAARVQLNYDELRGLALLRAAKQKFIAGHERCQCGRMKRRGSFCAMGCGK